MNILCLGGNVCLGARSPRGWPEHLWQATGANVVNGGIVGARLVDVVRSVPHQPQGPWSWVVIQTGAYDARGGGTPPAEYTALLVQCVEAIRSRWPDARVAVCTPTPVSPSCAVRGFNRSARRWISRVATAVHELDVDDVVIVDLHDLPVDLLADGVHPSPAGSSEIAARVARAIGLPLARAWPSGGA